MASAVQSCDAACCLATWARSASTSAAAADATAAAAAAAVAEGPAPDAPIADSKRSIREDIRASSARSAAFSSCRGSMRSTNVSVSASARRVASTSRSATARSSRRAFSASASAAARAASAAASRAPSIVAGTDPRSTPVPAGASESSPSRSTRRGFTGVVRENTTSKVFAGLPLETAAFVEGSDESDSENPTGDAAAAAASSAATVCARLGVGGKPTSARPGGAGAGGGGKVTTGARTGETGRRVGGARDAVRAKTRSPGGRIAVSPRAIHAPGRSASGSGSRSGSGSGGGADVVAERGSERVARAGAGAALSKVSVFSAGVATRGGAVDAAAAMRCRRDSTSSSTLRSRAEEDGSVVRDGSV